MNDIVIICINAIWGAVVLTVLHKFLAVKTAEAKLRLAKAEYYRKKAMIEKQMGSSKSSSIIDNLLEELGIDLENPLIQKIIKTYAKKFFDKIKEGGEEEIIWVG